jgi:hypothetical protein
VRQKQILVAQEEDAAKVRQEQKGEKSKNKRKKKKAKSKESKKVNEELEEARLKLEQQKLDQHRLEQQLQERDRNGYWLQQDLEGARMQLDLTRATSEDVATLREALNKTRGAYDALSTHYTKFEGTATGTSPAAGSTGGDGGAEDEGAAVQSMLLMVAQDLEDTEAELAELDGSHAAGEDMRMGGASIDGSRQNNEKLAMMDSPD